MARSRFLTIAVLMLYVTRHSGLGLFSGTDPTVAGYRKLVDAIAAQIHK
jgi:hypothetical protein